MKNEKRIRIGMMEIMPIFDMPAWDDIEKRFGSLDAAIEKLKASTGWRRDTIAIATILCNRALDLAGKKPLEERYVARMMVNREAYGVRTACILAITEGLNAEHKSEEKEDERIDLVLREIEKKEEPEA